MNNLVNGIIVLAVIAALTLSIIALVQPCKSHFEDSGAVPIIMDSLMEKVGIRELKSPCSPGVWPYNKNFKNDSNTVLNTSAGMIAKFSLTTNPTNPCKKGDTCYFVKGQN